MDYLIDTHILIWTLTNPDRLGAYVRDILTNSDNRCFFSPASIWEVAIKHTKHPTQMPLSAFALRSELRQAGFRELLIASSHTAAVEKLPEIHADPFDRLLIAQSQVESMSLVTHDHKLAAYGDNVVSV